MIRKPFLPVLLSLAIFAPPAYPSGAGEAPSSPEKANLIIGKIFDRLDVEADEWFHQGDYLRCVQEFRMQIARDPHNVQAYSVSAWLLWSSGRDDEAQEMFARAAQANPDNWEPYMEAGLHWSGRGDYRMAALWLSHACNRDAPVEAWKTLAHCYRHMGLLQDAIRVMTYAGTLNPADPTIPRNIEWMKEDLAKQTVPEDR